MGRDLILYDGECGLCDRTVQFILARDRKDQFRFAPLQSEFGTRQANAHDIDPAETSSFVLIEGYEGSSKAFIRGKAALKVCKKLPGLWPVLGWFSGLPKWLIDPFYNLVARNRYRMFGRLDSCRIPTAEQRIKFLG